MSRIFTLSVFCLLGFCVVVVSLPQSDDGGELALFLLSGGPRGEEVRPQRRQARLHPLSHQVLRQHLRRVPSTHPCGIKGVWSCICMYFLSGLTPFLPLHLPLIKLPSSIRSSAIRVGTGMRIVSVVRSVTSLWPRSPSAPKTTASCVGSAAPERMLHAATAATKPYRLVRSIACKPRFYTISRKALCCETGPLVNCKNKDQI